MNDMRKLMEKLENVNETTSEQYEDMLDKAGDLGEQIAGNVILDDHTNAWSQGRDRHTPEQIADSVDVHLKTATQRMETVAHRYIRRRLGEK